MKNLVLIALTVFSISALANEGTPASTPERQAIKTAREQVKQDREKLQADRKELRAKRRAAKKAHLEKRQAEKKEEGAPVTVAPNH